MIVSILEILGCLVVGTIVLRVILRIIVFGTGIIIPVDGFILQFVFLTVISAIVVLIFKWEWYWSFAPGGGLFVIVLAVEFIRQGILGKQPN